MPWEIWNLQVTERVVYGKNKIELAREKTALELDAKILSIVEAVGKHKVVPKEPERTNLQLVYDTTFPDVQPYLFKICYSFESRASFDSVEATVNRLFNYANV